MKFRPISQLFKKKRRRGAKQKGTQMIRLSVGFYKTLLHLAKEYNLTHVAAGDFMAAKAIEKVVEELKDKQTKHHLYDLTAQTVIEMGLTAKANRLAATPKKQSPGETPGAVSH